MWNTIFEGMEKTPDDVELNAWMEWNNTPYDFERTPGGVEQNAWWWGTNHLVVWNTILNEVEQAA